MADTVQTSTVAVDELTKQTSKLSLDKSLKLRIIKANDLLNTDGVLSGVSDPYVSVYYGPAGEKRKRVYKTRVIDDNLNPEWKESVAFPFAGPSEQIYFELFDKDPIGKDFLGSCKLALVGLENGVEKEFRLPLETKGALTVAVTLFGTDTDETGLEKEKPISQSYVEHGNSSNSNVGFEIPKEPTQMYMYQPMPFPEFAHHEKKIYPPTFSSAPRKIEEIRAGYADPATCGISELKYFLNQRLYWPKSHVKGFVSFVALKPIEVSIPRIAFSNVLDVAVYHVWYTGSGKNRSRHVASNHNHVEHEKEYEAATPTELTVLQPGPHQFHFDFEFPDYVMPTGAWSFKCVDGTDCMSSIMYLSFHLGLNKFIGTPLEFIKHPPIIPFTAGLTKKARKGEFSISVDNSINAVVVGGSVPITFTIDASKSEKDIHVSLKLIRFLNYKYYFSTDYHLSNKTMIEVLQKWTPELVFPKGTATTKTVAFPLAQNSASMPTGTAMGHMLDNSRSEKVGVDLEYKFKLSIRTEPKGAFVKTHRLFVPIGIVKPYQ